MKKKKYKVKNMHCASCATMIECDLEDAGVKAKCSFVEQTLEVEFDDKQIKEEKIKKVVESSGYQIVTS